MEPEQTENSTMHVESGIDPCRHMEKWVHALADGSLTGFALWFTRLHVAGCMRCKAALEAITTLRQRLGSLRETTGDIEPAQLTDDRHLAMEQAMNRVDQQRWNARNTRKNTGT